MTTATELPINTSASAMEMANAMFGAGIQIVSATYTGDPVASGVFTDGLTVAPGAVPADTGVILSTGKATRFTNATGPANASANTSYNTSGANGDPDLNAIAGVKTFDAAFLDAKFIPAGDTLTMQLVFSSEEYLEWVNSGYNDAVGIWVNGEKAKLTIGDGDISIDNINLKSNSNLFLNNAGSAYNTEMDGLTVTLTVKAPVMVGVENTLRFGIADAGDSVYDSNLLIVGNSVQTQLVAQDDVINVTALGETVYDLVGNDTAGAGADLTITHINGQPVAVGGVVTLETGETVRLMENGKVHVTGAVANGTNVFTYTLTDGFGSADTAYATVINSVVDGTSGNDHMMRGYTDTDGNQIEGSDGASEVVMGYGGNDKIFTESGDDMIYGGTGNDFIRAGTGNDMIDGGEGNDVLDGGAGADRMVGGNGNDIYYVSEAGDEVIETGTGHDKVKSDIDYTLSATIEDLWLNNGSAVQATGNALDNVLRGNKTDNVLNGLDGNDNLQGMAGDDILNGGAGNDRLYGGWGNDILNGGDGRDKLYGQKGNNQLNGGAGNDQLSAGSMGDVLNGGTGNDLMGAGAGADVFIFAAGDGTDNVKHFELGVDLLRFEGLGASDVDIRSQSWGLDIRYGDGDRVIMRGVTDEDEITFDRLTQGTDLDFA